MPGQVALARGHRGVDGREPEGPGVAVEHGAEDRRARRSAAGTSTRRCRSAPRARRPRSRRGTRSPRSGERASAQWHVADDLAHGCANRTGMARGRSTRRRPAGCGTIGRRARSVLCGHGHDDEHGDRRSAATQRRGGQGPRLDALRRRRPRPRPAARAAGPRGRGARAHRRHRRLGGARRAGGRRGPDRGRSALRRRAPRAAPGSRWRARRSSTPGSPWRWSWPRREAAAADGVDEVVVDIEPLERSARSRVVDGAGRGRGRVSTSSRATARTSAARTPRPVAATRAATRRSCRTTSPGASA